MSLPGACRLVEERSSTVCVCVFPPANSQLHKAASQKAAELKAGHQTGTKPPRTAGEQELGASSWGKRGKNEAQLHRACPLPWRLKSQPGAKPAEKGFCERVIQNKVPASLFARQTLGNAGSARNAWGKGISSLLRQPHNKKRG